MPAKSDEERDITFLRRLVCRCWPSGMNLRKEILLDAPIEELPSERDGGRDALELPKGTLAFAKAAGLANGSSAGDAHSKGHRRVISADSVMEPLMELNIPAARKETKETKVTHLLDLPDDALFALSNNEAFLGEIEALSLTCRRLNNLFLPVRAYNPLLLKTRAKSVSAIRNSSILFWNASLISDQDIALFVSWLNRNPSHSLTTLYLNHNSVTDVGLTEFLSCCGLPRLRHLSLASNALGDKGVMLLRNELAANRMLAGIHELNLRGNHLTKATRAAFQRLHHQNSMFVAV